MPTPGKIEATHRGRTFQGLGSFWTSVFREPEKVRRLVDLAWQTSMKAELSASTGKLAGDLGLARTAGQHLLRFSAADVLRAGNAIYDDEIQPASYGSEYDSNLVFDGGGEWYGIPWQDVFPLAVQGRQGRLSHGQDFWVSPSGWIFFRDDPAVVFPDGVVVIIDGLMPARQTQTAWLAEADGGEHQRLVTDYLRLRQTPGAFRLALAAVAGLRVLETRQRLLEARSRGKSWLYVFADTTLTVNYPHTPLTPGQDYPAGFIIGDGVQVLHNRGTSEAWWRQVNWHGGITLDPLVGRRGLRLLDREVIAYSGGSDEGSEAGAKLHARVQVSDNFWVEDAYWNDVAARESAQQRFLNGLLRLPEDSAGTEQADTLAALRAAAVEASRISRMLNLPVEQPDVTALRNTKLVNPLDVFFQAVFAARSVVVVLDQRAVPKPQAALRFIGEHFPAGCVPIVLSHTGDLPVERIVIGDTLAVTESVQIGVLIPHALTEQVNLAAICQERVEIRHMPFV